MRDIKASFTILELAGLNRELMLAEWKKQLEEIIKRIWWEGDLSAEELYEMNGGAWRRSGYEGGLKIILELIEQLHRRPGM